MRAGVIHKLGCVLGGSCLIPEGNGELTPLIRGDKFQMCLNVVRPTAVSALTSVLTTPITALRIGGRCTNEARCVAVLSIMQQLRCFRLQSVSLITQFAPQIPALPSWRLQSFVLSKVRLLSVCSDIVALPFEFKDAEYHKRKGYFKSVFCLSHLSSDRFSVLLNLLLNKLQVCYQTSITGVTRLNIFLCFLNKMWSRQEQRV